MVEELNEPRVEAILCGHTHYWQVANDGWNVAIATRSIGDPEGGPPGYTLLYLHEDDLAVTYRAVEDCGPVILITHPRDRILATSPRHIVKHAERVVVRTWSDVRVNLVRFRVDDCEYNELEPRGEGVWCGTLECGLLAKGEHHLEAVAVTQSGAEVSQRIEFMVDPTGRYTPVPEARPLVASTAFC